METRAATGGRILAEAGPTISIPDAAKVLGISRGHAYALAARDELPVRVLHLGSRMVVPTVDLRRVLGLDERPPTRSRRSPSASGKRAALRGDPGDSAA